MAIETTLSGLRPTSVLFGVLVDKAVFVASALTLAAMVGVSAPAFQTAVLILGLAATALGGFTAAWHARRRFLAHGLAVGAMAVAISFGRFVVNGLWPPAEAGAVHSIGWELLGWAGAAVAGVSGGSVANSVSRRFSRQVEPRPGDARSSIGLPVFFALVALFAFAEQLWVGSRASAAQPAPQLTGNSAFRPTRDTVRH